MFVRFCSHHCVTCKDVICAINNYTLCASTEILSYVIGIMIDKLPKIYSLLIVVYS